MRYLCEDHKRSQIEDHDEDHDAFIASEHGETCAMCEAIAERESLHRQSLAMPGGVAMTIRLPESRNVPGSALAAFVSQAQRRQKYWHYHVFVADVDGDPALCVRCHKPEAHAVHEDKDFDSGPDTTSNKCKNI